MLRIDDWPSNKQAHIDDHAVLHRSHNECLSVADFASFADALQAVPANGALYVPDVCRVESAIVIDKPLRLYGPGGLFLASTGLIVIDADDVWWDGLRFTGDNVQLLGQCVGQHHDWRFERCAFDGVSLRLLRAGRLELDGSERQDGTGLAGTCRLMACEWNDYAGSYTLALMGVRDIWLHGCHFHDCGIDSGSGDGIKAGCGTQHVMIADTIIERMTRDGIDAFDASRVYVRGGVIRDCGEWAFDGKSNPSVNETGRHHLSGLLAERCGGGIQCGDRTSVLGCQSYDHDGNGILSSYAGSVIVGNIALGSQTDIRIGQTATDYILAGNICNEQVT